MLRFIYQERKKWERFGLNLECSEVAIYFATLTWRFIRMTPYPRKSEKPKVKFTVLAEIAEIDYQGQFTFSSLFAPSLSTCQP